MPTELDVMLDQVMDALTAEGAPLTTVDVERGGAKMPMLAAAPPALPHYFAHFCLGDNKDKEFLVDGDLRLTFGEVYMAADRVAKALASGCGVEKGDRIGIAARNSANWIVAHMAILMAGGVSSLLNGWWQGAELAAGINSVGCKLVLADPQRAARLDGEDIGGAEIILFDHDCQPDEGLKNVLTRGTADAALPEIGPDDLATILFTSGSTGQSKGAYSDHRGVVQGVFNYISQTMMALQLLTMKGEAPTSQPATLLNVPLFHVTAEIPVLLQSIGIGRKLVLMPKWDAEEAMRLIEKEKVTYFVGVPLMSFEMATHPDRGKYDLTTCTAFAAGGAPRPVEHVKKIKKEMDWAFPLLGYGLTETNAVGCGNFNENYLAKPNSTGTASRPLVDLAILDDDGKPLPQGEVGEVCIRSVCNFLGYWENDAATREAITDDMYFRTGDLGYLDADDYLYIVDRKKDIIIRGGENISCVEVEAALYEHPEVSEASVFGLPDERFGEVPGAVFYTKSGAQVSDADMAAFLSEKLAAFKVPCRYWQTDNPLPKLGTAKIDKVGLRKKYQAVAAAEG
ncbi:class I adenylate-forming enzyme family protein [Sphingorhabdus sp. Alg239-R122]|uniref:class I adenylate-forming enzyme family protein n=1 Tax=Sphingorhabdus sp. Alg239-R122 TaxID=2305989 RepID=UPI0013DA5DCC|nr:class I adenylate-forming enzyme family protein [Sphingorhabdus sp. Alg239-R122]